MRIFLTGATGYVGSAVLDALLRGGHEVTALVRDPEKAERLRLRGVQAVVGDLSMPEVVRAGRGRVRRDHPHGVRSLEARDRGRSAGHRHAAWRRHQTLGQGSAGQPWSTRPVVWVLGNTVGQAPEDAPVQPTPLAAWRPDHEKLVLDAGKGRMLRTAIVRPGIVYGGGRGIIADLLKDAANGLVRVIGDGRNHWACVYDRDLADLYLRVVTDSEASGIFHATDDADERVADIVEAVARHAKMQPDVRNVPIEEARAKMGPYADALALNQIVRSPRARALGWTPTLHSVSGNVARLLEEFRAKREAA